MNTTEQQRPLLVSPTQAAKMLGCSRATIYAMFKSGTLGWVQLRADRRIPVAEIERIVREGAPGK